ncbi:MAG: alpha/beta hydrolase family esterase [Faecousia sp.]
MEIPFYSYTSTLADWDPVKTIFLCPPAACCTTPEDAEKYALRSGWRAVAEENKCLLIVPLTDGSWSRLPDDHLMALYNRIKNNVPARQGKSIWGRSGTLWCWEILLFAVGYEDGAEYVSRVQVAMPGFLAASALVNGYTADTSAGARLSNHWLVPNPSKDYQKRNCEIPVQTWLYTDRPEACRPLTEYWNQVNQTDRALEETVEGLLSNVAFSSRDPAHQVRIFTGEFQAEPGLARHILRNCFSHVVRWKNGPDGTLSQVPSREEFYTDPSRLRRTIGNRGNRYDYFLHLPAGKTPEDVSGLPLVVSVHGRGEPAWMYSNKNGWESLADETGAFVTLTPDSPGNIWFRTRDAEIFPRMIESALQEFSLDPERIYLTGFSNGGTMTRELSFLYPELFAAVSPWNGPGMDTSAMLETDSSRLPNCVLPQLKGYVDAALEKQWQIPIFMYYGDRDIGIGLESNLLLSAYLQANGCTVLPDQTCPVGYRPDGEATAKDAYANLPEGDRFHTYSYLGRNGYPMVCVTVMKNMPHGAIREQSRVAWEFLKHFRRPAGSKTVTYERR